VSATRFRAVLFALLSVSCFTETDEPDPVPVYPACPALPACNQGAEPAFSFVTLHRTWGPDRDEASYRFVLDEQTCTLSKSGAVCTVGDAPDDGSVPLFVSADVAPTGVGRMFRVDTFGRASAHLRIERDGVLVDEFDHVPTLTSQGCAAFVFDAEARRDLPEP
jgi:hypothetical protein